MDYQQQEAAEIQERIKELQDYNSVLRKRIDELIERVNKIKQNRGRNYLKP